MAENPPPAKKKLPIPPLPATAYTSKKGKQRQSEEQKKVKKREADRPRDKTRVNIGITFLRWRELRDLKGFKTDAELATFLFDSYGRYIQGPSISTPVKHDGQCAPVPSRSSIGVESERKLSDSRVPTEDNQVVLNSSCIKNEDIAGRTEDCKEAALDSRAVKSEEVEESIEGRNGYGLCQEDKPSLPNIKQEESGWMWKLVKREVGVTVKTEVVGEPKLKEEWNGRVQELEALDLKKERDGGTVEQTDRVLTEDGRLHCRNPAVEGSMPPVTSCLLKQPAVPTSGNPPMSISGLSVVFSCSQCPFVHKEEVKLLQHIEKVHPEEYKMILGYV